MPLGGVEDLPSGHSPGPGPEGGRRKRWGRICAVCHFEFSGDEKDGMSWCKVDRFFVCDACWEKHCARGHGDWVQNRGFSMRTAGLAVLFVCALTLPVGMAAVYDFALPIRYDLLPVTPIDGVSVGDVVKVRGVLNASANVNDVALGGHERHGRNGWYWEWDQNARFAIRDATGELEVFAAEYFLIDDPPNPAPNAEHTRNGAYFDGEEATIVGRVVDWSGGRMLMLLAITSGDGPIENDPVYLVSGAILLTISTVLICRWASIVAFRKREHEARAGAFPSTIIAADRARREEGLQWSGGGSNDGRRSSIGIGGSVIVATILMGVLIFGPLFRPHSRGDLMLLSVVVGFLFDLGSLGYLGMVQRSVLPEIAVSDRGVHFWYARPAARMLHRMAIDWRDVKDLRLAGNKSKYWAMEMRNGEQVGVDSWGEPAGDLIRAKWKQVREARKGGAA